MAHVVETIRTEKQVADAIAELQKRIAVLEVAAQPAAAKK